MNLKSIYEAYHGVKIEEKLIDKIIELSDRYIYDRCEPDKSIDILDEVCTKVSLKEAKEEKEIIKLSDCLTKIQKEKKESALIMRKQTKIAAVVSAAALLALGASMTSFAASKGTWMMVDGEWYCYDKNGDAYTNVFCSSNGKEYYVGDDGQLVRSEWVEYDGDYYFVNSSGAKITNDWRLTTPYDDDSADEEWYYFKSNGKRAENEKIT